MAASAPGMRAALEATRGATLAVHAAAGLARPCQHAARLLRAAEGLCRTATAILLPTPAAQSSPLADPAVSGAPRRRRRPRGQRKSKQTGTVVDTDMASQVAKDDAAAAASGPASVLTTARAPLLLQPAVGRAEPPELDDLWADDSRGATLSLDASLSTGRGPGTRGATLSLDASPRTGKGSGNAVVAQSLSGPAARRGRLQLRDRVRVATDRLAALEADVAFRVREDTS